MAKVIRCQCGFLGQGELVGKVTREDLIAMAEEA